MPSHEEDARGRAGKLEQIISIYLDAIQNAVLPIQTSVFSIQISVSAIPDRKVPMIDDIA